MAVDSERERGGEGEREVEFLPCPLRLILIDLLFSVAILAGKQVGVIVHDAKLSRFLRRHHVVITSSSRRHHVVIKLSSSRHHST